MRLDHGFTLIELMFVMVILAILGTLALPSFRDLVASQRLKAVGYDLVSDLMLARSEALKRGADVRIQSTVNPADWTKGWRVQVVSSSEVIAERAIPATKVVNSTAPGAIVFNRDGRVGNSVNTVRFGFSIATGPKGLTARCISLDPSGRPKSENLACP